MKLTALVVDDEPLMVQLISLLLKSSLGFEVQAASDNQSALDSLLKKKLPDFITTDYFRPFGTGDKLLEAIKSNPATERIPVAVISGGITDQHELDLYRSGAAFVLRKPFQSAQFFQLTRRILKLPDDHIRDLIRFGNESRDLDYKREFDISDAKARASIAKDVIAMSNSGGGNIVIGIEETESGFKRTGLTPEQAQPLEATKINDALQTYTGSLAVTVSKVEFEGKIFVVISIPSTASIVFPRKENADARLFLGRIYIRSNAARSEEVRDSSEAARLVESIVARRAEPRAKTP